MQQDPTKSALVALLQVLEGAERPLAERPILTLRPFAQGKSESADPETPDQNTNRLAERIASALLKLRPQKDE
jgi:hypothetical protein